MTGRPGLPTGYRPLAGDPPTGRRTAADPLKQDRYLRRLRQSPH
jgi:hypothetical protein